MKALGWAASVGAAMVVGAALVARRRASADPACDPRLAPLAEFLRGADHVDVKMVAGCVSLRAFLAGMLSYQPAWITALYHVRGAFVRLLGMRQERVPQMPRLDPATVPMTPGTAAAFFTVRRAEEDRCWYAEANDTHLSAGLGVVAEPDAAGDPTRFFVVTVVRYRHWTGPVYFNAIRPFHHLVVGAMARAGAARRRGVEGDQHA